MQKKVLLCGFMGCGKSTLLKSIEKEGLNCVDLDDWIFKKYAAGHEDLGTFIRSIGWTAFREIESKSLKEVCLETSNDLLLALGGGTLDQLNNRDFIDQAGLELVWLDVDFNTCLERIKGDTNRPLVSENNLAELKELFLKRQLVYELASKRLTDGEIIEIKSFKDLLDK